MNNEIKYKELLNLKWSLDQAYLSAQRDWDKTYDKHGKQTVLYDIAQRQVYELREAKKTLEKVITVMRKNSLYVYGADGLVD